MKASAHLRSSTKRAFDAMQRFASRIIWGAWLLAFLFWEGTGDLPYTPWRTLSETAWDVEENHPGTKRKLEIFLIALTVHIRYKTTLESSIEWAYRNEAHFNEYVRRHK